MAFSDSSAVVDGVNRGRGPFFGPFFSTGLSLGVFWCASIRSIGAAAGSGRSGSSAPAPAGNALAQAFQRASIRWGKLRSVSMRSRARAGSWDRSSCARA